MIKIWAVALALWSHWGLVGAQDRVKPAIRLPVLVVPKTEAVPREFTIDILDRSHALAQGVKLKDDQPPITIAGRQIKSLDFLRSWLRIKANPRLYPDVDVSLDNGSTGLPLYASRKPLLIRCDREQNFGWAQAIMQLCTFVPGQPRRLELLRSPLIYKVSFGVGGTRRLMSYLPTKDTPTSDQETAIALRVPESHWNKPTNKRQVRFFRKDGTEPLGRAIGFVSSDDSSKPLKIKFDPPDTLSRISSYLKKRHASSPNRRMRLHASPRVAHVHAMTILSLARESGFREITHTGAPRHLIRDLQNGKIK